MAPAAAACLWLGAEKLRLKGFEAVLALEI